MKNITFFTQGRITAIQPVFNPFSQFVPQLELHFQLKLSLWSDPIAFSALNEHGECK